MQRIITRKNVQRPKTSHTSAVEQTDVADWFQKCPIMQVMLNIKPTTPIVVRYLYSVLRKMRPRVLLDENSITARSSSENTMPVINHLLKVEVS